jgi:cytochrome c-type biogenesis protein CcmH
VTGEIELDPQLAAQASSARTLFVTARSATGPRVPLAVLRVDNPALPRAFRLDDSLAMDPARRLSSADQLIIEVRLSRSGNALREPGDLISEPLAARPGQSGLKVRIDRVVQP